MKGKRTFKVSLIAAVAEDMAIGKDNDLIWSLRDDLALFKRATVEHAVVMGRKSFEAIGKPLPKRRNIIVTRRDDYQPEGVEVASSLEGVHALFEGSDEEVFILGGGEIYRQTLEDADYLYISHVHAEFPEADTHFPTVNWDNWSVIEEEAYPQNERNEFAFTFRKYLRK